MPEWIKRLWNDPVWSKVIAAGILVGTPGAIHYRNVVWPTPLWVLALLAGLLLALTYAASLRRRIAVIPREIGESLLTSKPQSSNSSKLVIHSAQYQAPNGAPYDVTEFLRQMITGDGLGIEIENHNFVIGNTNYVSKDPAPFLPKLLKVQYSYDRSPVHSVERPEHSRLILPEDTFLKNQESLSQETIRRLEVQHKSDLWRAQEARQHCEEERRKALRRIEELEATTLFSPLQIEAFTIARDLRDFVASLEPFPVDPPKNGGENDSDYLARLYTVRGETHGKWRLKLMHGYANRKFGERITSLMHRAGEEVEYPAYFPTFAEKPPMDLDDVRKLAQEMEMMAIWINRKQRNEVNLLGVAVKKSEG